jgi:hypothetical protein
MVGAGPLPFARCSTPASVAARSGDDGDTRIVDPVQPAATSAEAIATMLARFIINS